MTADTYYDFARDCFDDALILEIVSLEHRVVADDGAIGYDAVGAASDPVFRNADTIARALEDIGHGNAARNRSVVLRAISERVRSFADAMKAIAWLAVLDPRLAVWAVCSTAEKTTEYASHRDAYTDGVLNAMRLWVAGQASERYLADAVALYPGPHTSVEVAESKQCIIHSSACVSVAIEHKMFRSKPGQKQSEYNNKLFARAVEYAINVARYSTGSDIAVRELCDVIAGSLLACPPEIAR